MGCAGCSFVPCLESHSEEGRSLPSGNSGAGLSLLGLREGEEPARLLGPRSRLSTKCLSLLPSPSSRKRSLMTSWGKEWRGALGLLALDFLSIATCV